MASLVSDIAVVGHFTIDSINLPNRPRPVIIMGGAAVYTSFASKRLGASVSVVSKVGDDFLDAYIWWLQNEGVNMVGVTKIPGEKTTSYEIIYDKDFSSRTLRLKNKSPAITLDDVPIGLHARAIHLGPIAGEITFEVVERLKESCEFLSLDPQGMSRSFDENGHVSCNAQIDPRVLGLINVYKSSKEEILVLSEQNDLHKAIKAMHKLGPEIVLVTMGIKGSVLSVQGAMYNIPSCKSAKLIDPTGAGDVFIGAFLTEYIGQKELLWCACVGSAAASLVVEGVGPTFFGEKEEIYNRANDIYEKGIKQ